LVVNALKPINPQENFLQETSQVKGRNQAAHCEHAITVSKLETVSATAKMAMAIEFRSGKMFDPDALRGRLTCLLLG
jgi:hypothetical protein